MERTGTHVSMPPALTILPFGSYILLNPCIPLCIRLTGVTLTASSVQAASRHTEDST